VGDALAAPPTFGLSDVEFLDEIKLQLGSRQDNDVFGDPGIFCFVKVVVDTKTARPTVHVLEMDRDVSSLCERDPVADTSISSAPNVVVWNDQPPTGERNTPRAAIGLWGVHDDSVHVSLKDLSARDIGSQSAGEQGREIPSGKAFRLFPKLLVGFAYVNISPRHRPVCAHMYTHVKWLADSLQGAFAATGVLSLGGTHATDAGERWLKARLEGLVLNW